MNAALKLKKEQLNFVPLHLHTQYSIKDGEQDIDTVISRLKELNISACAITDHGRMYGVYEFWKKCKESNIKPIVGVEAYIENGNKDINKKYFHMILLVKNKEGYVSLCHSTRSSEKNKYRDKPMLTDKDLAYYFKDKDAIIATSACLGGEIQQLLLHNKYEKAKERALFYDNLFGHGNFYIELQNHLIKEQVGIIPLQIKLAKELDIPLTISSDSHFARPEDKKAHDMVICMQWGKTLKEYNNSAYTIHHCIKGAEELLNDFKGIAPNKVILEALQNTVKISEMCNFNFEKKEHYPKFPKLDKDETADSMLRKWAFRDMPKKVIGFNVLSDPRRKVYYDRLEEELDVIRKTGYSNYFLIVADVLRFAKSIGGYTGLGRGSGVSSLVAFSIGITKVDPIQFNLFFARFLNTERVSPPDFDLDFDNCRNEVFKYTTETYGEDKVCYITTFGTMAARGCIRDVGKIMGYNLSFVDMIAKMVPMGPSVTLKKALGLNLDSGGKTYDEYSLSFKEIYDNNKQAKDLIDNAMKLEGLIRQVGTHAAAVIIADKELTDYIPLEFDDKEGVWKSQFYKDYNEALGLLKLDYLGLNTLNILKDTAKFIKERHGIEFTVDSILEKALEDKEIIKTIYQTGNTVEVFQFESKGMRDILKSFQPTSLNDLILLNAMYRPGPLQYIPKIIYNKNHPDEIKYDHECLKPILEETYGYPVYQEQIMSIFRVVCGYTLGQADIIRRAMSKKHPEDLVDARKDFINGYKRLGVSKSQADKVFDGIMDFASYSFNRSHAAAYAITSLETAFYKKHFPVEYMAACLKNVSNNDNLPIILNETRKMGIKILSPDINLSDICFRPEGERSIRFGLSSIKNIGKASMEIVKSQPYKNIADFLEKTTSFINTDKSVIESLAYSGAFDSFGYTRKTLAMNTNLFTNYKKNNKKQENGQIDFFNLGLLNNENLLRIIEYEEFPYLNKLEHEREVLSCYCSGHPLEQYRVVCDKYSTLKIADIDNENNEKKYNIIGMIHDFTVLFRKSDSKEMCKFYIEDTTGKIEAVCFTKVYDKLKEIIKDNAILQFTVKVQSDDENSQLVISDAKNIDITDKVFIKIENKQKLEFAEKIIKSNPGCFVPYFYIEDERRIFKYSGFTEPNNLIKYFGENNVSF